MTERGDLTMLYDIAALYARDREPGWATRSLDTHKKVMPALREPESWPRAQEQRRSLVLRSRGRNPQR